MHSKPEIVNSSKLSTKVYVEFYIDGKRAREYSGKKLGLRLSPNASKNLRERTTLLIQLCKEFTTALNNGTYPPAPVTPVKIATLPSTVDVLTSALNKKLSGRLSRTYKRDLTYIHEKFLAYLTADEKAGPLPELDFQRIEKFLNQFSSSNTYYMNKRTDLATLFATAGRVIGEVVPTVKQTERRRVKSHLNVAYEEEQVKPLLAYLKQRHPKLYMCCLLTYGSLLRPHVEIRSLTKGHFYKDNTTIKLSGSENKGGAVRIVYVPEYTRDILKNILEPLKPAQNIFTGTAEPLNPDYFKTAWNRLRQDMIKKGLIRKNQTIYSLRHTAAVQMYKKTKDIYLLQRMLAHSSVLVTQKYLRSLGEADMEELRFVAPEL